MVGEAYHINGKDGDRVDGDGSGPQSLRRHKAHSGLPLQRSRGSPLRYGREIKEVPMTSARVLGLTAAAFFGLAALGRSQDMSGLMNLMRPPNLPGMQLDLEEGSGAESQLGPVSLTFAIIGEETVDGQDGHWVEARLEGVQSLQGKMIFKMLLVGSVKDLQSKRMIVQLPGWPPIEPSPSQIRRYGLEFDTTQRASDASPAVQLVSSNERVTVPAGSFDCQHFRMTIQGKPAEYWTSPAAHAWGMVSMKVDGREIWTLKRVLEGEKSQILGEPKHMSDEQLEAFIQAHPLQGSSQAPAHPVQPPPQTQPFLPAAPNPQLGVLGNPQTSPLVQSYLVVHFGLATTGNWATDYCVGAMTIQNGVLAYRAVKGTHPLHAFDFPLGSIKEIKKNGLFGSAYQAFHVRMKTGETANFALLDETGQRFLNPGQLLAAVNAGLQGK